MSSLGRARAGTWVAFLATGAVTATWAARIPAVQDRLGLSPGGLAVVVIGIEGGALIGLPLGGALVTRRGSRWSLRAGLVVYAPGLLVAALAPTLTWLAFGLGVWAAANSVVDVALNAEGTGLEAKYERPVLSGLHAAQGIGLLLGALGATVAAALEVSLLVHYSVVSVGALATGLVATGPLLNEAVGGRARPRFVRPSPRLLTVGAVAFCAFLVDGAATNWIAVHLASEHQASSGLAAAGYFLFIAAVVVGRLRGDWLTVRLCRTRLTQVCGVLIAVGTAVAVLAPYLPVAMVGWTLIGLGVAPLAPAVLGTAPHIDSIPAPTAIATVTTVGYLGSFLGPPAIGATAEWLGLSAGLVLLAVAGVIAVLLARALAPPSA